MLVLCLSLTCQGGRFLVFLLMLALSLALCSVLALLSLLASSLLMLGISPHHLTMPGCLSLLIALQPRCRLSLLLLLLLFVRLGWVGLIALDGAAIWRVLMLSRLLVALRLCGAALCSALVLALVAVRRAA